LSLSRAISASDWSTVPGLRSAQRSTSRSCSSTSSQAYPYEPNTRYEERFSAAQEQARAAGIGIWGLSLNEQCLLADRGNGIGEGSPGCSGATASASPSPSASASAPASASPSSPSPSPGGGEAPSGGGDIDCDQVNGPIPTPPGDPDGLDGGGDGLSCE
jgi:hypothetical protein